MEHKGKWKKRWIALGLSLMMILAGLPVEGLGAATVYAEGTESGGTDNPNGVTALAEDEAQAESGGGSSDDEEASGDTEGPAEPEDIPQVWGIYIDANGNLNPWEENGITGNDNDRYFKVAVSGDVVTYEEVPQVDSTAPEDYNFHYDKSNHTLTLKDMNVSVAKGTVIASDYDKNNADNKLTIKLIGNNKVQTASGEAIYLNGNTVVTGSGSLTATTTCGWVKYDEESDRLFPANEGDDGAYCPAAIEIGKGCARFVNDKNTTITAIAANAESNGKPSFSAWRLACGAPGQKYIDEDEGNVEKSCGRLVNYGTIIGKIELFEGSYDKLVSCETEYGKPTDHDYIGKAYYFTDVPIYPNNMVGTLPEGTWRVVGKYDKNGEPIASKVWYQYIYTDAVGSVYTEDRKNQMQFLVYEEDAPNGNIESMLKPNDVAAVDDGLSHTFTGDLYAVWLTNGNVTVNGNVTLDVACSSAPEEEWKDANELRTSLESWDKGHLNSNGDYGHFGEGKGADCYKKDEDGDVMFKYSPNSSITINGNTGFLSLSDSYQGTVTVRDDINFCATYAEREFLKNWIYRLQWQYDESPYHPEETFYCAVPKAGKVVENGQFTQKVKDLALAEGVILAGQALYEGTYFSQTETQMPTGIKDETEKVAGTSAAINDSTLLVNVSKKNGLEKNTYPLVRKASNTAVTAIQSKLSDTADMVAMDIAMIQKPEDVMNGKQTEVEPTGAVNLYFDKLDLSKLTKPALYHIKDDGTIEKIAFTQGADKKHVQCQTTSFSTYVFAEDQAITGTSSGNSGGGGSSTGSSSSGSSSTGGSSTGSTGDKPSSGTNTDGSSNTETKPDGTKVETSTETKADGTKVNTKVETKTDGTKTETIVETAKDGSVKTTETVTKADGSATKTEKETETNTKGKEVAITIITEKDASGKVTGITQTSEIPQIAGSASATVTVEKAADGKITSAEAEVNKKGVNSKQGVGATLFGSVVSQITEAAGTKSVDISMTVTAGKKEYTVKADAQDLEAGNKLKVMAIDEKTGAHVLVNAKTYTVSKSGSVKLTLPAGMTYQLMDKKEAAVVEKQILATVKPKKSTATIAEGKKTTLKLSSKLDMDNVAKITYSSDKKSVATVSKTGKITGKNSGTVVITAKVTLKNGKTKKVKMTITVN